MSALHTVDADPKKVKDLENRDVDGKVAVFALQRTNNDLDEAYQIHSIFRMEEDDVDASLDQSTDSATQRPGGFGTGGLGGGGGGGSGGRAGHGEDGAG